MRKSCLNGGIQYKDAGLGYAPIVGPVWYRLTVSLLPWQMRPMWFLTCQDCVNSAHRNKP